MEGALRGGRGLGSIGGGAPEGFAGSSQRAWGIPKEPIGDWLRSVRPPSISSALSLLTQPYFCPLTSNNWSVVKHAMYELKLHPIPLP